MLQNYELLPFDSELNLVYNYYRRKGGTPKFGTCQILDKLESWKRAGSCELEAGRGELEDRKLQMKERRELQTTSWKVKYLTSWKF